ncbi:MAG: SDR family NAD(P)-dependent oxidoreductase [Acidobacteria bacterium]|nr:SDR family NAD(P)-dependent oxidoreductase [Acidobacteriota bacterium]
MLLKDKVAIVTGAAEGIGAGIAELFAQQGARVILADIKKQAVEARAAAIRDGGGDAVGLEANVANAEQVRAVVDEAIARYGRIDILINNAGIYPRQGFLDMTEQQWDEMQEVNLKSMFHTARLVAPHMVRQRSGHIVNISSVTFFLGMKNLSHYVASKGGVIGFSRSIARELGEYDIHVNCITPGAILTEGEVALKVPQSDIDFILQMQSLKRRLLPKDIANACLFLSSELSSGITGQIINVDGGWTMY